MHTSPSIPFSCPSPPLLFFLAPFLCRLLGEMRNSSLPLVVVAPAGRRDFALAAPLLLASFSGVPGDARYNLLPGACVAVNLGENLPDDVGASSTCLGTLECGATYVFRAIAHANNALKRSDFTSDIHCSTQDCDLGTGPGCTYTWVRLGAV